MTSLSFLAHAQLTPSSWTFEFLAKHKPTALPFNTTEVEWTDLRKNDIVAVQEGREINDIIRLYRLVRINKNSFSLIECDMNGAEFEGSRKVKWDTKYYPAVYCDRLNCEVRKVRKFHKVL
jgi:hypothetical protein